jgi:hypothetical protein
MALEFLPFTIEFDKIMIAGSCLWSLAFYITLSSFKEWVIEQLTRWFNFADRSLYLSQEEYDKSKKTRNAQNTFYAAIVSIIPFLILGACLNYGLDISLGKSWTISLGLMTCILGGVYELGKQSN